MMIMDTKNIIIICLVVVVIVMALAVGFLIGQQGSNHNNANVTNNTNATHANNTINNTSSNVEKISSDEAASSNEPKQSNQKQVDYNSPDSKYYKWDTDGSYHEKEEGVNYIYAQDAVTGEWSYWADKR